MLLYKDMSGISHQNPIVPIEGIGAAISQGLSFFHQSFPGNWTCPCCDQVTLLFLPVPSKLWNLLRNLGITSWKLKTTVSLVSIPFGIVPQYLYNHLFSGWIVVLLRGGRGSCLPHFSQFPNPYSSPQSLYPCFNRGDIGFFPNSQDRHLFPIFEGGSQGNRKEAFLPPPSPGDSLVYHPKRNFPSPWKRWEFFSRCG